MVRQRNPCLAALPDAQRIPAKLLLVGTLRLEELIPGHVLQSWLEDLRSGARLDEVELGPLSAAETIALAENEAGHALEPDAAAQLFAETEGHPLFVVESVLMAGDSRVASAEWSPSWEVKQAITVCSGSHRPAVGAAFSGSARPCRAGGDHRTFFHLPGPGQGKQGDRRSHACACAGRTAAAAYRT